MTVKELIEKLAALPQDAEITMDANINIAGKTAIQDIGIITDYETEGKVIFVINGK